MYQLSKSKIISYLQCPKRIWLQVHKPDEAEVSEGSEKAIHIGYDVGEAARRLYPHGQLAGSHEDIPASLATTESVLKERESAVLFEAAFKSDGILIFADIVEKQNGAHRLIEVKSSTSAKDYQINDASIQAWVMKGAGFVPNSVVIRHINNEFVYPGGGRYDGLFYDEDITARASEIACQIPLWIDKCRETLKREEPSLQTGDQCDDPFPCEFYRYCTKDLPPEPEYPVTILPRGGKAAENLISLGYTDLREVPGHLLTNNNHLRVWKATCSGEAIIDQEVRNLLSEFGYPRCFLDFEGINLPVPIWEGTRPYQQIPFQYSCHIDHGDGRLEHHAFLHSTMESPIRLFITDLLNTLAVKGPVFVYNQAYEKTVLSQMAELLPDLAAEINAVIERIVDLLPITRTHYYHPQMKGSWSIKAVLPTISPELDYDNLDEVADGSAAQEAFMELISPDTPDARKEELKDKLLKYCGLDTYALVALMDFMEKGRIRKIV